MAPRLIVIHGGLWHNNIYEGGMKECIPLPPGGLTYVDLLTKLEVRLKKDKISNMFEIDALVEDDGGEFIRMKVTDDFEWCFLKSMNELTVVYVNAYPKCKTSSSRPSKHEIVADELVLDTTNNVCEKNVVQQTRVGISNKLLLDHERIPISDVPIKSGQIEHGSVFMNKDLMISAVHAYHLKNFVEFRTKISDPSRYHVACKSELTCVFSMRSKAVGCAWKIYQFIPHTCVKDSRTGVEPRVSARSVSEYVSPNMAEDGFILRPRDIQGQLLREYGVRLKYRTALAGKNRALRSIYRDHHKSFQMVARYLWMLERVNPGSLVDLQTCQDLSFKYCFFALDAAVRAFPECRPVVVIDATHLKGTYRGVLFVASTKDANEQILPLAFGIGDKENDSSWIWFLENVRKSFGTRENLLIVSDQHVSIKNAVDLVYPGTPHGLCTYHIQGNLRSFGHSVIDIFQLAANAYKVEDFNDHMHNLELYSPGAHSKLMGLDPKRWARCKCPVRRYAFGTSNAVESLNGRLVWARKLPITSLLEYARNLMQEWFYERRNKTLVRESDVSEYAEKRLGFAVSKGNSMTVQPISNFLFNIISREQRYDVDLCKRECSCKVFQLDLFPCSHATAAIRYKNEAPLAYIDAHYSTEVWRATYASLIMPTPDMRDCHIPDEVQSRVVLTPVNPKQAGRPKNKRIVSGPSSRKNGRLCSRCLQLGHYATTCTVVIDTVEEERVEITTKTLKRTRSAKKCGICGVVGHSRQTCQDPHRFE